MFSFSILRSTPAWVESFPGNAGSEPFAELVGIDGPVLVPANLLLAFSPLLRSMMTDPLPPVESPLVILLPGVREAVLQVVKELLMKGLAVMNTDMKTLVEEVFEMISIRASFTCSTEEALLQDVFEIEENDFIDQDECQDLVTRTDGETSHTVHSDGEASAVNCNSFSNSFDISDVYSLGSMIYQEDCQDMDTSSDGESSPQNARKVHSDRDASAVDSNSLSNSFDSSGSEDGQNNRVLMQEIPSQVKVKKCYLKNVFIGSKLIRKHMRLVGHPKVYSCQECEYQSSYARDLRRHMIRHTGEKPFKCDFCEYKSGLKSELRRHNMRVHSAAKPFKCDQCDFTAGEKSYLSKHMEIHSVVKSFKCYVCGFRSKREGYVRQHMLTHTQANSFNCDLCDYKSNFVNNLKRHLRTHVKEEPTGSGRLKGNSEKD